MPFYCEHNIGNNRNLIKALSKTNTLAGHGGKGKELIFSPRSSSCRRRSRRLRDQLPCHSTGCPSATDPVKLSRWRRDADGVAGGVFFFFFNNWWFVLLWFFQLLLLLIRLPPTGHGGSGKGVMAATSCSVGGGGVVIELIYAGGILASTILCRHGGVLATSGEEALLRSRGGCSKRLSGEVICSPSLGGGP
jgi:hypothetical protein